MEAGKERIILRDKDNYEVWKFQYDTCTSGMKDVDKRKYIVCSVQESVLRRLTTCKTSIEMLDKLHSMYGVDVGINKLYLQNKFYSMTCINNKVMEFIEELDNLASKLEEIGEKVSDQMMTAKALNSLPITYEPFVTAFECGDDTSFAKLRSKLMCESERQKIKVLKQNLKKDSETSSTDSPIQSNDNENEKVFTAKSVSKICEYCNRKGHDDTECYFKRKNKYLTCHNCNQKGHVARYCKTSKENKDNSSHNVKSDNKFAATVLAASDNIHSTLCNKWIIDTGATRHMVGNKDMFTCFDKCEVNKEVMMPNGDLLPIEGIGEVVLKTNNEEKITLTEVLFVPKLKFNLLASRFLTDQGIEITFLRDGASLKLNEKEIMTASIMFDLYVLDCEECCDNEIFTNLTLYDWHVRLGHQNLPYVKDLLKRSQIAFEDKSFVCEHCKLGKMHRKSFDNSKSWETEIGDLVHMDVGGPMEVNSLGGNRYYLLFRDDHSNWRTVYFMKKKSDVKDNLVNYLAWFENQTNKNVKRLRSDNGLEEVNSSIEELCSQKGIIHEKTCPYTPEQNGRIERDNRTIVECARTMLVGNNLSKNLWAEATNAAVFILNRTGRTKETDKTPIELFFKKKPDLNFLKPYGSNVFVHVAKAKRKKWDAKARKGKFVGYDDETKGYRILFEDSRAIEIHRDVDFVSESENVLLSSTPKPDKTPNTIEEAMSCEQKEKWRTAIEEELQSMKSNDVWETVETPVTGEILDSKWIFKVKDSGKYKARLVARGFAQKDLNLDTYAPVARIETIRLMLSLAVFSSFVIHQMDVDTAFLNGVLEEDIFLKPPAGVEIKSNCVLKLKKSIYGLKQAPKCWNEKLNDELKKIGFEKSKYDECLYIKENMYLLVYVDDLLLIGKDLETVKNVKLRLCNTFSMKDLGEINRFLGINFKYDSENKKLELDQKALINETSEKFLKGVSKTVKTPMEKDMVFDTNVEEKTDKPYRELLGTLMYIMSCSRPDISYAVNYLSRYQECASEAHYKCLTRVLKYLKATEDLKLLYKNEINEPLICEVDATWADKNDRKSTSGYVVKVFGNPVIWKTRKQSTIALSSAEAEYIALYEATRDIVWVSGLLTELKVEVKSARVFEDNNSCISIASKTVSSKRTKHFDVKYHYVKEKVEDGTIRLERVDTSDQTADILTKALGPNKFLFLRRKLCLEKETQC